MTGFSQLVNGLLVFDALVLLDKNYFVIWEKDLFKNTGHLSEAQLQTACNNNWQIVYKSFTTWLEKESFHDSYFDLSIEQILAGDPGEYFGYFIAYISVILIKNKYLWNQSVGNISDSNSYNYLKSLEDNLTGVDDTVDTGEKEKMKEGVRDENQTLVDMITDLKNKLKSEEEKVKNLRFELETKGEEAEEIKKMFEMKSFEVDKMRLKLDALEQNQREQYEVIQTKTDQFKLLDTVKKLEHREEELELNNSLLRDKVASLEKLIQELKEVESKFEVDDALRKKYDMVCERNDVINTDLRKKDLEIEGLKYQIELLKKNKEVLEANQSTLKLENMKLEQQIMSLMQEIHMKDQDNINLDRIIIKLKEQLELNMMSSQGIMSPGRNNKLKLSVENLDVEFKKSDEDERIMQLELEVEKLKAEKELGWIDMEAQSKNNLDKELLTQEATRLIEKVKRLNKEIEDFKRKEEEWNVKDGKYNTACKNFKKTITELKKELDSMKSAKESTKTLESFYSNNQEHKKQSKEEQEILYSIMSELIIKNKNLTQEKLRSKNRNVELLESSSSMFEKFTVKQR